MIFDSDWLVRDPSIDEKGKFLVKMLVTKCDSDPELDRSRAAPFFASRLAPRLKLA
ncbi:hypothetical protein [Sphingopyxis sp. PET50]|uniref:hypothetical protein n=1 Tax=Sphingopyxis sp. PET50 TaxID=2976533 RepID=UPI0021AF53B1|nr:hypothetical protein [Sphingopyxis sp. PET50]